MPEVCPKCGLPKDLCICEELAKEEQEVVVKVDRRRYGKAVTLVKGLNSKEIDLDDLASKLKRKLACGGTTKNGIIELQGDHRDRIEKILIKEGFPEESINIK